MDSVTVIIPTYNRVNALKRSLEFLAKSKVFPEEVIVVDQTEDMEKAGEIEKLCIEQPFTVHYFYQEVPSSTKARNRGITEATGDIVVFMDDDVDVQPDTFANLQSLFEDETLTLVGGFDTNTKLRNSFLGYFFGKTSFRKRYRGHVTQAMYGRFPLRVGRAVPTEWAMGFFFAIRKSCLDRWQLRFDERLQYYAYAEDLDFTYAYFKRASAEGLHCIMSSDAEVTHNCSKEYRIPSFSTTCMQLLHREYLRHKHLKGLRSRIAIAWSNLGDLIYRTLRKENPRALLQAIKHLAEYREDVHRGAFHYEAFMNRTK